MTARMVVLALGLPGSLGRRVARGEMRATVRGTGSRLVASVVTPARVAQGFTGRRLSAARLAHHSGRGRVARSFSAATAAVDDDDASNTNAKAAASRSCPGAKAPVEETVDVGTRGDVGGIQWASERILALDAASPGWWTPPAPYGVAPTPALSSKRDIGPPGRYADGAWWRGNVPPSLHPKPTPPQLLSVAPMMDYTTAHFRHLCRLLSSHTWLYTEMEVDQTLVHTDHPRLDRYLDFPTATHPSVLQLGGSDPEVMARATAVAAPYGYDEINLNCGCPSPKVAGKGAFGAALMLEPHLVREIVCAMRENSGGSPVTVKCRIGVDDYDSYDDLCNFVEIVSSAMNPTAVDGRPLFAIHARKAILGGLSPAENRTVPPLRYEWAYALARDFPEVGFVVNGGIDTLREAADIADGVGVPEGGGRLVGTMIGRAVHADPWGVLSDADVRVFGSESNPRTSRRDLLVEYVKYCDATHGRFGTTKDGYSVPSIRHLMHPLQNLFLGEPNAKVWRRKVDEALKHDARNPDVTVGMILERTLGVLSDETLDAPPGDRSTSARHGLKKSGVTLGELPPMPTRTVLVPTGR
tara:strand:- start:172 stop:1920 length:1749 start_codon:yes stop_codon:yes gene_type:complete